MILGMLARQMNESLAIKWPWEMVWTEYADQISERIKNALPPDHELQEHDLFPGIKWDGRPIFIVDDDTTGECVLMDFEKMTRWRRTKFKVPMMEVFGDQAAIAARIERDHLAECAKHSEET